MDLRLACWILELRRVSVVVYEDYDKELLLQPMQTSIWEFPKIRVPYFGVLIIRILSFRVLY